MDLCRTCLSCSDLSPIFDGEPEEKISGELQLATGIVIKPDDGFPQKICKYCIFSLTEASQFRERAIKAHHALIEQTEPNTKPGNVKIEYLDQEGRVEKVEYVDDEEEYGGKIEYQEEEDYKIEYIEDWENYGEISGQDHMDNDGQIEIEVMMKRKREKRKVGKKNDYSVYCNLCGKKCFNKYQMLSHKRAKHNMEKIHKCQHCDYESSNKEALVIHLRLHTGEKPYVCDICGSSFHRRANLVQHLATHIPDAEKKFQCPICLRMYASQCFVRMHIHKIHQEKKYFYKCNECTDIFSKTTSARNHMVKKHGIPKEEQGPLGRILRKEVPNKEVPRKKVPRKKVQSGPSSQDTPENDYLFLEMHSP